MSRADTLKEAADHFYALADLFNQLAGDTATAPVSAARPVAASLPDAVPARPPVEGDFAEGSEVICPIHKTEMKVKPWDPNLFGCTKPGSDPAWTNPKGYCTITSKNVAQYLRNRAAVA